MPTCFQDEIGALEKGRRADMSLIRLSGMEAPYVEPDVSILDRLLYRGKARDVAMVQLEASKTRVLAWCCIMPWLHYQVIVSARIP